jgi:RecJ-like exonuclease
MNSIECPMCHCEGCLEEVRPGGYFSQRSEQWYPLEESKECPCCNGTGSIDKPHHDNTFNLTSDYQQLKEQREAKRSATSDVLIACGGKLAQRSEFTLRSV